LGGSAASKALEAQGERMITRNFIPGFRIELHQKDLNLALESARKMGVSLPNTATVQELFNSCGALGGVKNDNSYLVAALEALANHKIGK
jgi:2-hydroxy-3-oxopropionate reductase